VTGAHNFKVGYQAAYEVFRQIQTVDNQLAYTFNNGAPTQFTMRIGPHIQSNRTRYDGFYAQDQWTHGRLTLQSAVRYEHAWSWFPEGENGILADNRFGSRYIFPRQEGVTGFHDITPRMGAAYDLFGNGKTSVKVNISKYLEAAQNGGLYTISNPAVTFQQTTTRSWTDGNGNFIPDCDLMNPVAQNNLAAGGDSCGAWNNSNFGNPFVTTRVNPEVQHGWGVRNYDWQFGIAVQHEILPRVAVDVSYNRRWWGNFFYTDNLALGAQDFDQVTIAAPLNPNLPDGGGYPVTFLTRTARTALARPTTTSPSRAITAIEGLECGLARQSLQHIRNRLRARPDQGGRADQVEGLPLFTSLAVTKPRVRIRCLLEERQCDARHPLVQRELPVDLARVTHKVVEDAETRRLSEERRRDRLCQCLIVQLVQESDSPVVRLFHRLHRRFLAPHGFIGLRRWRCLPPNQPEETEVHLSDEQHPFTELFNRPTVVVEALRRHLGRKVELISRHVVNQLQDRRLLVRPVVEQLVPERRGFRDGLSLDRAVFLGGGMLGRSDSDQGAGKRKHPNRMFHGGPPLFREKRRFLVDEACFYARELITGATLEAHVFERSFHTAQHPEIA
jgi:hypothetical protein